jgi:hypothetical protein
MSQEKQRPVKEFRIRGVRAAVWERQVQKDGRTFTHHSVRIYKSYRDQQGQWHETDFYGPNDLPAVRLVAERAFEFVALKESQEGVNCPTPTR